MKKFTWVVVQKKKISLLKLVMREDYFILEDDSHQC